jgi:hypothetical protein
LPDLTSDFSTWEAVTLPLILMNYQIPVLLNIQGFYWSSVLCHLSIWTGIFAVYNLKCNGFEALCWMQSFKNKCGSPILEGAVLWSWVFFCLKLYLEKHFLNCVENSEINYCFHQPTNVKRCFVKSKDSLRTG